MKVLLDECVTHALRPLLVGHEVITVAYMNWSGIRNGVLLRRAKDHGFDLLVTTDTAIADQQHSADLPLPVLVLHARTNRIVDVLPLVPACLQVISSLPGKPPGFHHVR